MFRSRRSVVIKRLWNSRLKHVTLPETDNNSPVDNQEQDCRALEKTLNAHHVPGQPSSSATIRAFESFFNHFTSTDYLEEIDDFSVVGDFKKSEAIYFYELLSVEQLEELLEIVKSVKTDSDCILWSYETHLSQPKLPLYRISCHLYRWPDATPNQLVLRPLPFCKNFQKIDNVESVKAGKEEMIAEERVHNIEKHTCCNPYHWSRVLFTDAIGAAGNETASLQSDDQSIIKSSSDDSLDKKPLLSSSCSEAERNFFESYLSSCPSDSTKPWCVVAYWEFKERVGSLFYISQNWMNVFQEPADCSHLPQHLQEDSSYKKKNLSKCFSRDSMESLCDTSLHDNIMCLKLLQEETSNTSIAKCRNRIGMGITACRYRDGEVWIHNRSQHAIFVSQHVPPANSLERSNISQNYTWMKRIRKIEPGYCLKLADRDILKYIASTGSSLGPFCSAQISFVKGWGPSYMRQSVMQCPCWLEILLYVDR